MERPVTYCLACVALGFGLGLVSGLCSTGVPVDPVVLMTLAIVLVYGIVWALVVLERRTLRAVKLPKWVALPDDTLHEHGGSLARPPLRTVRGSLRPLPPIVTTANMPSTTT